MAKLSLSLKVVLLIFIGSLIAAVFYFFCSFLFFKTVKNMECSELNDVLQNKVKVTYLNEWVKAHVDDKNTLQVFGHSNILSVRGNPSKFNELDFNWEALGLNSRYGSIAFNERVSVEHEDLKLGNIKSVSFIYGRASSIVVALDDVKDLGLSQKEVDRQILTSEKNIYINCED